MKNPNEQQPLLFDLDPIPQPEAPKTATPKPTPPVAVVVPEKNELSKMGIANMTAIANHWSQAMFYIGQENRQSPFRNPDALPWSCEVFEVRSHAHKEKGGCNFKWQEIEISWNKVLGKDTISNIPLSDERASQMFKSCFDALRKFQEANFKKPNT